MQPIKSSDDHLAGSSHDSKLVLLIGVLAALVFVTRLPGALHAISGVLLNEDELIMTFTVLDRFLGVPPAFLSWPGGTLQLLGLPVALANLIYGMGFGFSAANFMAQLAQAYRDPWR